MKSTLLECMGARFLGQVPERGEGWERWELTYASPDELFVFTILHHPDHETERDGA